MIFVILVIEDNYSYCISYESRLCERKIKIKKGT